MGGEVVDINGWRTDGLLLCWKDTVTLTTSWQPVTLSLATLSYDHVISPFGWDSTSTTKITFYYDNVVFK